MSLYITGYYWNPPERLVKSSGYSSPIEWLSARDGQIISDLNLKNKEKPSVDELLRKAKYLSKRMVRVKEEVKAESLGYQRNEPLRKGIKFDLKPKADSGRVGISGLAKSRGNFRISDGDRLNAPYIPRAQNIPPSIIDQLPDGLKVGNMTALNTDQFVYYSFFERARDRVYVRWVKEIANSVRLYAEKRNKSLPPKRYTTTLQIILDRDGNYENSIIQVSSGEDIIDEALPYAFKMARQIPHPPDGLIDREGRVRLDYRVTLDYRPQASL
jgi:TonB family protein